MSDVASSFANMLPSANCVSGVIPLLNGNSGDGDKNAGSVIIRKLTLMRSVRGRTTRDNKGSGSPQMSRKVQQTQSEKRMPAPGVGREIITDKSTKELENNLASGESLLINPVAEPNQVLFVFSISALYPFFCTYQVLFVGINNQLGMKPACGNSFCQH